VDKNGEKRTTGENVSSAGYLLYDRHFIPEGQPLPQRKFELMMVDLHQKTGKI
jgi:hypothetical protein